MIHVSGGYVMSLESFDGLKIVWLFVKGNIRIRKKNTRSQGDQSREFCRTNKN